MRNITYKYNIGDVVELKPKHRVTVNVGGKYITLSTVIIVERRDYNGPAYRFEGINAFYKENCIAGRAPESFLNDVYDSETKGPNTTTPEEQSESEIDFWAF